MLMYCDLLTKSGFLNKIVMGINTRDFKVIAIMRLFLIQMLENTKKLYLVLPDTGYYD